MSVDLTRAKWNYRATMAAIVVLASNIVGGWMLISGRITWTEWGATVGILNGTVGGWIAKPDPSEVQQ